eukprot:1411902-Pyramimonas_sp.AAC.4
MGRGFAPRTGKAAPDYDGGRWAAGARRSRAAHPPWHGCATSAAPAPPPLSAPIRPPSAPPFYTPLLAPLPGPPPGPPPGLPIASFRL